MKKLIIIISAALLFAQPFSAIAQTNDKGNRKISRQEKKLQKQEFKGGMDAQRINKENHKQRKQIAREAKRANKKRNYDTNEQGNVLDRL